MSRNHYAEQARLIQRNAQVRGELRQALNDRKHLRKLLSRSSSLLRSALEGAGIDIGSEPDIVAFLSHIQDVLDMTADDDAKQVSAGRRG